MTLDNLQKNLEEVIRARGVPGAAVAVWDGGTLHEAAAGVLNLNTGVEATADSVYQVGSTTKVWTAALVMQLVEEGLVDLDAPVRTHVPGFVLADEEAAARVTVRHLLTHTPGFDGDIFLDTGRGDDCVDLYLAVLKDAKQITPPGATLSYCNAGFNVLGALVANLRGMVWEEALRKHLLTPLGCTHASLYPEEAVLFRASAGHVPAPDGSGAVVAGTWQLPRSSGPAGGVLGLAPRELVRFGRMILAGGVAEDGTRVLSEESVRAMLTPQVKVPDFPGLGGHWGLGFHLMGWGRGAFGHDGGTIGQTTEWWIAPERGVVFALNANGGDVPGLHEDLVHAIARDVAGLDVPRRPVPPAEPAPVDTAPYLGNFEGPLFSLEVADAGGHLDVTTVPGPLAAELGMTRDTVRYVPLSEHHFIAVDKFAGRHAVVGFEVENGRAVHLFNGRTLPRA
ncbi:serine hydrolase domain-containing protein [Sinosporangium siamense]|uniref:Serine hydrolase n=1 Tax=Sinosporangium siamense TaxID=1367973 RepID=A0A919RLH4_9ACTN|nr:serine hydrolase domain-containing protein [Sinosporangium siamense]GII96006.1 serine hydrolase [Sinosporangium siamense]